MQDKYEGEIERHIRDSSDKEELNITIQRLNAEKKDLKHQVFELQEQLKSATQRLNRFERGAGKLRNRDSGRGLTIQEEVADIRK